MSVDYFVAIHGTNWPTPVVLNRCLGELDYPVAVIISSPSDADQPLTTIPGALGFVVSFESKRIDLEASITKLGPDSPYAFGMRPDVPKEKVTLEDGATYTLSLSSSSDFIPLDLNADLQRIGAVGANFSHGDYVLQMSFRSEVDEYRAGFFLMAGLIKCADGFGFEFQTNSFGTYAYADGLARAAADPDYWR
ncbi:hypothetical protein [Mesorhizobium sp. BE184]|uniref:hypothetical protein n=1 Tax=Mesorhizobium sp. BE184 TaxID=2817714 RepID=UPI0028658F0A|nr:hypothetical protein [Mesorhizobium sp. BE184]MDR7033915.1 hypothetical protein [Mesorhizobium sp. BE184]